MAVAVGGKRGIVSDPNIVPLIDILLVLLVIFMVIPPSWGSGRRFPRSAKRNGPRTVLEETKPPEL